MTEENKNAEASLPADETGGQVTEATTTPAVEATPSTNGTEQNATQATPASQPNWSAYRKAEINKVSYDTPAEVSIKSLMGAGCHFGHQTKRWNPQMSPYIYGVRNDVHILNLDLTMQRWKLARQAIVDCTSRGGKVLFVGTKKQAQDIIAEEAVRSESFFVASRWLGGTLTNFSTIKRSVERMKKLEELLAKAGDADSDIRLAKKEQISIARDLGRLEENIGGIKDLKSAPDLVFVVDVRKEAIAIAEARKLHIPVIALVDTNASPKQLDYIIPSNDDAAKTIRLFARAVADAVIEGNKEFAKRFSKNKAAKIDKTVEAKKKRPSKAKAKSTTKSPAKSSAKSPAKAEAKPVVKKEAKAPVSKEVEAPAKKTEAAKEEAPATSDTATA